MPRTAKVEKEGNYLAAIEEVNARIELLHRELEARGVVGGSRYDPLVELAVLANDPVLQPMQRANLNAQVAKFIYAEVRSLEFSNPQNRNISIKVELAGFAKAERSVDVESVVVESSENNEENDETEVTVRLKPKRAPVNFTNMLGGAK